jgi:hypothetical protein
MKFPQIFLDKAVTSDLEEIKSFEVYKRSPTINLSPPLNIQPSDNLLLTFGCSWTFGTGAEWHKDISRKEQMSNRMDEEIVYPRSFRGILSKKFKLQNINYAFPTSSNQRNFRIAREIFTNEEVLTYLLNRDKANKILVVWGITGTGRNEIFDASESRYKNFKYDIYPDHYTKFFTKYVYSHENEVSSLSEYMNLWNVVFDHYNIDIIWVDMFNTHHYSLQNDNIIPGDCLTKLCGHKEKENIYHSSAGIKDDIRIIRGMQNGNIEPLSYHPSSLGYKFIADIISPYVKEKLND